MVGVFEVRLVDVYGFQDTVDTLYRLLEERPLSACISHKRMPSRVKHNKFVASRPYAAWYLIEVNGGPVGAIYLTHANEIGVGILRKRRRAGSATKAIKLLMELHPRDRYYANINPENEPSALLFSRLGFQHIQDTYALDA